MGVAVFAGMIGVTSFGLFLTPISTCYCVRWSPVEGCFGPGKSHDNGESSRDSRDQSSKRSPIFTRRETLKTAPRPNYPPRIFSPVKTVPLAGTQRITRSQPIKPIKPITRSQRSATTRTPEFVRVPPASPVYGGGAGLRFYLQIVRLPSLPRACPAISAGVL